MAYRACMRASQNHTERKPKDGGICFLVRWGVRVGQIYWLLGRVCLPLVVALAVVVLALVVLALRFHARFDACFDFHLESR